MSLIPIFSPGPAALLRERGGRAYVPSRTLPPLSTVRADLALIVDDENLRISLLHFGGYVFDYDALAQACTNWATHSAIHVFATRPAPSSAHARTVVWHRRPTPGKNADVDAALFVGEWLVGVGKGHALLLVTGDHDFLAMHNAAEKRGVTCAFLCPPAPYTSRWIMTRPHSVVGRDLLLPHHWR